MMLKEIRAGISRFSDADGVSDLIQLRPQAFSVGVWQ